MLRKNGSVDLQRLSVTKFENCISLSLKKKRAFEKVPLYYVLVLRKRREGKRKSMCNRVQNKTLVLSVVRFGSGEVGKCVSEPKLFP